MPSAIEAPSTTSGKPNVPPGWETTEFSVPKVGAVATFRSLEGEQEVTVTRLATAVRFRVELKGHCERVLAGVAKLNRSENGTEEGSSPEGLLETVDEFTFDDPKSKVWLNVRIQADRWAWANLVGADDDPADCRIKSWVHVFRAPGHAGTQLNP